MSAHFEQAGRQVTGRIPEVDVHAGGLAPSPAPLVDARAGEGEHRRAASGQEPAPMSRSRARAMIVRWISDVPS